MTMYLIRHCKTCGLVLAKHASLNIWRCRKVECAEFDRPRYEKRVTRKAVQAALGALA